MVAKYVPHNLLVVTTTVSLANGDRNYTASLRSASVEVQHGCHETTIHGFINMPKAVTVAFGARTKSADKLEAASA